MFTRLLLLSGLLLGATCLSSPLKAQQQSFPGGGSGGCGTLPTTPNGVAQVCTSTPSGGVGQAGVFTLVGTVGRTVSGASDTILCSGTPNDSGNYVLYTNAGAVAVTLGQAGTSCFTNNFRFGIKTGTGATATITPGGGQIAGSNGTLGANLVVPPSSTAICYSWDNANWQCSVIPPGVSQPFSSLTTTCAGAQTWALGSAWVANASITITGSCTLNLTNPLAGGNYVLAVTQGSGGSHTLALGTGCIWKVSGGGAGAITPSTTAGAIDVLAFTYDGTNCYANYNKNFN